MFHNSRVHRLYREQLVSRPLDDVFAFFAEADNLERITPPWLGFGLLSPDPIEMGPGTRIESNGGSPAGPSRTCW
jgi:ligand-binding SRPBCC domain-containing protein